MMPHRAYVDFPKQITKISRGIRKYSTVRAKAKLLGGKMQTSVSRSTNEVLAKFLGSIRALSTLVKILNSLAARASYPYDDTPYEIFPSARCASSKGSIIPFLACSLI